jgi:succinyl-CoA synthetase beta subunit
MANDAQLIEINPLAAIDDQTILVCDSKVNVDDNSLFRHQELRSWDDLSQKDPKEVDAEKFDLNYISLDGNIGCMVNGAGLAMATM